VNNSKIKLSLLFFDFLFEQFCLDVDKRTYFLKEVFATNNLIKEKTGYNARLNELNYFVFRDWMEDFSLELRSIHKEYLFTRDKDNTFHSKELMRKVLVNQFDQNEAVSLFNKALDICMLDLQPYPWKIQILKESQTMLGINDVVAKKVRKTKVIKSLNLKVDSLTMNATQKYYALFLCSQLMFKSDGHLDRSEASFLKDMFAKFNIDLGNWRSFENIIKLGSFSSLSPDTLKFSESEKRFLISIMSLIVMGDGDLDSKEVLSLRHYFEKFDLQLDDKDYEHNDLRCSIDEGLSHFDNSKLNIIFCICLDLSLSDGILHGREIELMERIYTQIRFNSVFDKEKFVTTVVHTLVKNNASSRAVKVVFDDILESLNFEEEKMQTILCELQLFYSNFYIKEFNYEIRNIASNILKDWNHNDFSIKFNKLVNGEITPDHMLFYIKVISMSLEGKCAPEEHEKISQGLNNLIMALKPNELSDSTIYYVIQAALFDGVLDIEEDKSIIQFMIHFGVSEERVNRILQLHSIEIGKEYTLSRFYHHGIY